VDDFIRTDLHFVIGSGPRFRIHFLQWNSRSEIDRTSTCGMYLTGVNAVTCRPQAALQAKCSRRLTEGFATELAKPSFSEADEATKRPSDSTSILARAELRKLLDSSD
jgi:hypothetical protein